MVAKRRILKSGDVISIKLNEKFYGYGQFLEGSILGCYIFYDLISEEQPNLQKIINHKILLLTFTVNQKIVTGEWKVIGNAPIPEVIIPEFKTNLMQNGLILSMVTKYDGTIIRQANEIEKKSLNNFKSYSPSIVENALKAKFGIIPWDNYYNELLYKT